MDNEQRNEITLVPEESRNELDGKWLTFWIECQLFGVTIADVEQIVGMQPITEIPEYPSYTKGIIHLRGNVVPLVDLRLRLGKFEAPYNDHTCIIINRVANNQIGFIVDEVDAVIDIPTGVITPPPQMGEETANRYLIGVARLATETGEEKIVLCLDVTKVLLQDEIMGLSTL